MKRFTSILIIVLLLCCASAVGFASGQEETAAAEPAPVGKIIEDPGKNSFDTLAEWEAHIGKKLTLQEAPIMAKLVAEDTLPPLEERLPKDPMVLLPFSPVKKIGEYQDVMYAQIHGTVDSFCGGLGNEIGWNQNRYALVMKSWHASADGRVFTWYLREGLKWSDGTPYTTEDIMFWYEDVALNTEISQNIPSCLQQESGNPVKLDVIDDFSC